MPRHSYDKADQSVIETYIKRMKRYPLLTPEQERQYGGIVQAWLRPSEIGPVTQDIAKRGVWARNKLVTHNQRLVFNIATKYMGPHPLAELIQHGNMGLTIAAEKYDPSRGCRFTTCSYQWIRQSIVRAIHNESKPVRLPSHAHEALFKIRRAMQQHYAKHNAMPSVEEAAIAAGVNPKKIQTYSAADSGALSLDVRLLESGETWEDRLADASGRGAYEERSILLEQVLALPVLTRQERNLLKALYVGRREVATLADMGRSLGLSKERVRQIRNSAIAKLQAKVFEGAA